MTRDESYVARLGARQFPWPRGKALLNSLEMELTERCNNNCIHCYINLPADDEAARAKELTTHEIKAFLKEAASLGCLKVRFTGGEPLLREDFEEIYTYTRKLGIKVILSTNATLITPRLSVLFATMPPLEKVDITLYGMERESCEAVTRVAGSHEAAWRGVRLLLEQKIPFRVKNVILPPNEDETALFEEWAGSIPWEEPPEFIIDLDLRARGDSAGKNRRIKELRKSPVEALAETFDRRGETHLEKMRTFCTKFHQPPGDRLFRCGAGVGSGCIDAYGVFQPCILLRHKDAVVSLSRQKGALKKALEDFFPAMREIKAVNPMYLTRCAPCFLKSLCDQCPGKSWMEHGVMDAPVEHLCEVAHGQARRLGLLKTGEVSWEINDWESRLKAMAPDSASKWENASI